jgi:hypothetical protein
VLFEEKCKRARKYIALAVQSIADHNIDVVMRIISHVPALSFLLLNVAPALQSVHSMPT